MIFYISQPMAYYIVCKTNTEWMYRLAVAKAQQQYQSVRYEITPPSNMNVVKSLNDLPDEIRDDVNGAVAMYMMGRGNCPTIDPDKLIPNEPRTSQELGVVSFGSTYSRSNGLPLLDV